MAWTSKGSRVPLMVDVIRMVNKYSIRDELSSMLIESLKLVGLAGADIYYLDRAVHAYPSTPCVSGLWDCARGLLVDETRYRHAAAVPEDPFHAQYFCRVPDCPDLVCCDGPVDLINFLYY